MTNQSSILQEIKCRLKAGTSCYYSVQTLSSRLLSKNLKIKIYESIILLFVLYGPFTGPEPVLSLPYTVVKRAIGDIQCWKSSKDCKHAKALMEGLNKAGLLTAKREPAATILCYWSAHRTSWPKWSLI